MNGRFLYIWSCCSCPVYKNVLDFKTSQLTARWINASPDYQMKNYIPKIIETSFDNQSVKGRVKRCVKIHDIYKSMLGSMHQAGY